MRANPVFTRRIEDCVQAASDRSFASGSNENTAKTTFGRMILIFTSIAATAGCDNEVRRSLSNMIDDQEQTAEVLSENIQEYIGEFEHELREHTELMTTQWDASDWEIPVNGPDAQFNGDVDHDYELVLTSGCPMIDFRTPEGDLSSEERSRQMGETIRCRCLRNIGNQYRRELNALRPEQFGEMRENLAMVTDEELGLQHR